MGQRRAPGVVLLYTCILKIGLLLGLGLAPGVSLASGLRCQSLYQGQFALPEQLVKVTGDGDLKAFVSEILKRPLLQQGASLPGIRLKTDEGHYFLILNLGRLRRIAPQSLEWGLVKEYLTEFIPSLYQERLALPDAAVQKIKESFGSADFLERTTMVLSISSEAGGSVQIQGGMGVIVAQEGAQRLPLEVDVPRDVPGFQLKSEAPGFTKRVEVIRTGIRADNSDPRLFEKLVWALKALVIGDEQIGSYYFHTTKNHLTGYRRKLRSLKSVMEFKSGDIDEVVAVVERNDLLREFGK